MIETSWDEYWWSRVTGPREVVSSAISALRSRKSVVLLVPRDLPWRHELRRSVRSDLESIPELEDLIVDTVDIEDEGASDVDPGKILLDRYALKGDRTGYREGSRESIQDYLLKKRVISNKLVWIKGIGANCSQKWVDFCEHWKPRNIADGIFVIEVREQPQIARSRHAELIRYEERVSEYDAQLFNSLVIGDDEMSRLNASWKRYAASVTTHLCGTDAEVAQSFMDQHRFKEDNPIETLREIAESDLFNKRGSGAHVLAVYRDGNMTELNKRIWAGQVEVLFPLIERQRLEIVDKYRLQFETEIGRGLKQFDADVEKPEDIELGTMVYMIASKRLDIPDHSERQKIHVLRDCRNRLAHRDVCDLERVKALLEA